MDIKKRVLQEADYILLTNKTIREIANEYKVSKSTVHKDLNERLEKLSKNKYYKVKEILNYHSEIKHIRGGLSTKNKYKK